MNKSDANTRQGHYKANTLNMQVSEARSFENLHIGFNLTFELCRDRLGLAHASP